jgi:hypothetical protein
MINTKYGGHKMDLSVFHGTPFFKKKGKGYKEKRKICCIHGRIQISYLGSSREALTVMLSQGSSYG